MSALPADTPQRPVAPDLTPVVFTAEHAAQLADVHRVAVALDELLPRLTAFTEVAEQLAGGGALGAIGALFRKG